MVFSYKIGEKLYSNLVKMVVQTLSLLTLFSYIIVTASGAVDSFGCRRDCGNIKVPYPFGIIGDSGECFRDANFEMLCNETFNPPRLFLSPFVYRPFPVSDISLENATVVVEINISFECYNETGISSRLEEFIDFVATFLLSTRNRFFAIGCDTIAVLQPSSNPNDVSTGCTSMCNSNSAVNFEEELLSCQGNGCCQTPVPENLMQVDVLLSSRQNHSGQLETNPCSFAFLADPTWYKKNSANFDLKDTPLDAPRSSLVVLDWAIRDRNTCENVDALICGENTECSNSSNGSGYLCHCKEGFQGNPYTQTGCK